jgi:hypothetical protein
MSQETQSASAGEATNKGPGTYVYGIVRPGASVAVSGEDGVPEVRLVEADDLAALVSDSPEKASREAVLSHNRVLEAALEDSPVVPLRFGFVMTDDDAVRKEILEEHHDELAKLLERFEGRVQLALKIYYHEDAIVADVLAGEPELARLRDETRGKPEDATYKQRVRLGELLNKAIEKRRERDGKEILDALRPLAEAVALEGPEDELMLANVVFLLTREQRKEFEAKLEEIAGERTKLMRFRLIGPMPAYNFIDVEGAAWG